MADRILIAGGGIAALETAAALRALAGDRLQPVLIAPERDFRVRALDLRAAFGAAGGERALRWLAGELGAELVRDAVVSVDAPGRSATLRSGRRMPYDGLVVAVGARPYPAWANGITFDRPSSGAAFDELLTDASDGLAPSVAVVVPDGVGWTLPAYDLSLGLRRWSQARGHDLAISLYTPESQAAAAFGTTASRAVRRALAGAAVELHLGLSPIVMSDGAMMAGGRWTTVSRIIALPRLAGPRTPGLPCDADGFIRTGPGGRVDGLDGVWAAGDGTTGALKQGGLAAQQADEAAIDIAQRLGIRRERAPRVLRGVLDTPDGPLFLQCGLDPGTVPSQASRMALWHPPAKVCTRWLGPYLAWTPSFLVQSSAA
jgi:sulfide:quinone oxidoreductase